MPSPRLTRALAAGALSWLVGCSLFTDLGGLTSGSEGGSSGSPDARGLRNGR